MYHAVTISNYEGFPKVKKKKLNMKMAIVKKIVPLICHDVSNAY